MVPEVSTGDPTRMFCLNCARRIVSPRSYGKYDGLRRHLRFRSAFTDMVKLSFAKLDGIIGDNLPMSAFRDEKWWSNSPISVHAKAWLDAGWEIEEVNLKEGYVVFRKVKKVTVRGAGRRRSTEKISKPFTPAPYRFPKRKKISKTKAAMMYARIKNLERKRSSIKKLRGSFKPKPAYERKLYKPDEKPK